MVEADIVLQDSIQCMLYRLTSGIVERLAPLQSAVKSPHENQPVVCVQNGEGILLRLLSPGAHILKPSNAEPTGGRFENGEHVTFDARSRAVRKAPLSNPSREIHMRTAKAWLRIIVTSILSSMSGRRQTKP